MNATTLTNLLETWKSRLGMQDWVTLIKMSDDPHVGERPVLMSVNKSRFYKQATITLHNGVFQPELLPPSIDKDIYELSGVAAWERYIEAQIVHELLHCSLRDLTFASDLVRDQVATPVAEVWDGAWSRAEEEAVDRMATALVASWPQQDAGETGEATLAVVPNEGG